MYTKKIYTHIHSILCLFIALKFKGFSFWIYLVWCLLKIASFHKLGVTIFFTFYSEKLPLFISCISRALFTSLPPGIKQLPLSLTLNYPLRVNISTFLWSYELLNDLIFNFFVLGIFIVKRVYLIKNYQIWFFFENFA